MSPRYDIPKAAPEPLLAGAAVPEQRRPGERGRLAARLARGARAGRGARARARRCAPPCASWRSHNGRGPPAAAAVEVVNRAAARLAPRVDADGRVSIASDGRRARRPGRRGVRRDARRQLGAAQGLPQLSLVVLRLLAEPIGRLVLDAALRQPREDARLPPPQPLTKTSRSSASSAFWTCRRFSASSQIAERSP